MHVVLKGATLFSLLLSAAIFGFFYAWVCSTMWGLDQADPRVAIEAMQAMNASVRNIVFAPAFFGTWAALFATAALFYAAQAKKTAGLFAAAGATYFIGAFLLTMTVNVPMNEALARVDVPGDIDAAGAIWREYSGTWQVWNITRTVVSGIAFLLAVLASLSFEWKSTLSARKVFE